jgi:hypothetical protein
MERRDLIFRVFVSSTFSDLIAERNALQERVFPELRRYCQERGARFQAIDPRWGVSEEAGLDQQTMNICLQELARCQTVSPRPNFIVLLGERYGWRPLPAQIEAREFEELLSRVPEADRPLLNTDSPVPGWRDGERNDRVGWYRKDLNAVSATYVLQPRTIEFPDGASDGDKDRIRKEEALAWSGTANLPGLEGRIRSVLLAAIKGLNWPVGDPRRFKYEASATHQEVRAGALETENPQEHVFCYFRKIAGLPEDGRAAIYRDIMGGAIDAEAEGRLRHLKEIELGQLLPGDHIHTYQADWRNGEVQSDLDRLCDWVKADLQRVIDREIAAFRQKPGPEREREAHREFAEERCRHFVGREEILRRIETYITSDDTRPLVVHGKSGSGKTALMSKAWLGLDAQENYGRFVPAVTIARFIGATPGSSDLRTLLGDICRELGLAEIPQDMNELVKAFRERLSPPEQGEATQGGEKRPENQANVVLFLDALDQLNPTDNARMLYWLPRKLRPNVKLVLSVLQTDKASEARDGSGDAPSPVPNPQSAIRNPEDPFDLARRIWPGSLLEVGALDDRSAATLLDSWLHEAGRTLQDGQRAEVLGKFARCPLPLYLKLALEEARRWKSWAGVPVSLSDTVEGILEQLLTRLERPENHGAVLVSRSLGYLATGKNGLTEDELLDVLSADKAVLGDFIRRSPTERAKPETERLKTLPVLVWSRLFADIRSYMTRRRADETEVMDFYHRQVGEAVRVRYLAAEDARVQAHLHLADYFHGLDYWAESLEAQRARAKRLPPTPRPANVRKVVELPYHRLEVAKLAGKDDPKSKYWDAVADLLTDWQFLEAKAEADPNFREQESHEPSCAPTDPAPASEEAKP